MTADDGRTLDTHGEKALVRQHVAQVEKWHSWASLIWNRTVHKNTSLPTDTLLTSRAKRTSYLAKVIVTHLKETPWLGYAKETLQTKSIYCDTADFHRELVTAVLEGFIMVRSSVVKALEHILNSMRKTLTETETEVKQSTILFTRHEYEEHTDSIRSYVRLIHFSVTEEIRNISRVKSSVQKVKCEISYLDYEARFDEVQWQAAEASIDGVMKQAASDFVKQQTVDVEPDD
ncbi:hypothetical protein QBC44DRAFT_304931 [Cladorrhinum sp. PSN332]|nr:hypothetical protein QBC44DRAFT_304931 [Cladorrhinum sp. PSN332]